MFPILYYTTTFLSFCIETYRKELLQSLLNTTRRRCRKSRKGIENIMENTIAIELCGTINVLLIFKNLIKQKKKYEITVASIFFSREFGYFYQFL